MTTSNRNAAGFSRPGEIRNATAARAGIMNTLANNHLYLAVQDTEMITVFIGAATNASPSFQIRANPYAAWVEFFIFCTADYAAASTTALALTVVATGTGDSARCTQFPAGEDTTTTGIPLSDSSYGWVRFVGRVTDDTFTDAPRAISIGTATNAFTMHNFRVDISSGVHVRTIQYRVLAEPPPYEFT